MKRELGPQDNGNSSNSGSKVLGDQKLAKKYRRWLQFEVAVLCVLMAVVWGLLTLPIIFYYHPAPVVSANLGLKSKNSVAS